MTNKEAVTKLNELEKYSQDNEAAHGIADGILLEVLRMNGLEDIANAFETASERITFWYA